MKIVIDYSEKHYESLKNLLIPTLEERAILNGTVLPKGHGKLVDADILLETLKEHRHSDEFCIEHNIDYAINLGMVGILIGDAPTVIEADKTESEG